MTASETANETRLDRLRLKLAPVAIAIMGGAQIVDTVNISGFTFTTTEIAVKYGVTMSEADWVLSAYTLTFGSFMILGGKFGDVLGHRTVFMAGMAWFGACCLILAVVNNIYVLFVFRALQGVGAAFSLPPAFGMITHNYSGQLQAAAIAAVGVSASLGGTIGIFVGGGFAGTSSGYQGIMYLCLGISWFFAIAIFFCIPETPRRTDKLRKLDIIGSIILVAGMILVVFAFESATEGWSTARFIAPLIIGLVMMIFFPVYEAYIAERVFGYDPLVPAYVWKFKNLTAICTVAASQFAAVYVVFLTAVLQTENINGTSPIATSVKFIALTVSFGICAMFGGVTFGKFSVMYLIISSPIALIVGSVLFSRIAATSSYWRFFFPGDIFIAMGGGLSVSTIFNLATNSAPLDHQGLVSGMISATGQMGTSIGLSVATSIIGAGTTTKSYQNAYYSCLAYSCVYLAIGTFFIRSHDKSVGVGMQKKNMNEVNEEEETKEASLPITEDVSTSSNESASR